MDVQPTTQWIKLDAGLPTGLTDKLLVSALHFEPDPNTLFQSVVPAVIAVGNNAAPPTVGALSHLKVGLITVGNFEVTQTTTGIATVDSNTTDLVYVENHLYGTAGDLGTMGDWFDGVNVDWGDSSGVDPYGLNENLTHTYSSLDTYDITLELVFNPTVQWVRSNNVSVVRRVELV